MLKSDSSSYSRYSPAVNDRRTGFAQQFLEIFFGVVLGLIFYILKLKDLAQITWIIGGALCLSRFALVKKIEEEMRSVHLLESTFSLLNAEDAAKFHKIMRAYMLITQPEFKQIKDTIIQETESRLDRIAREARTEELSTGDYYLWLNPTLRSAPKGSSIWAVSMMHGFEWDDSPAETEFLKLNLAAADRGACVERVFVVKKEVINKLSTIEPIREQIKRASDCLVPLVVEWEYLSARDPQLLKDLGDGLIAFDSRVALIDQASPEGKVRGYVTMNATEIEQLRRKFESLKNYARNLKLDEVN